MKRIYILLAVSIVLLIVFRLRLEASFSVADRLQQFGSQARLRLKPDFDRAKVSYPPHRVTLLGLKQEKILQIYASGTNGIPRFIRSYPILAASGGPGPKLREGDGQVPEGIYGIESLNPNSRFHVSLRVNYPNAFDRARANKEGRTNLGGDIMIHGNAVSIGCLAMGDQAAEDLFVLAADTGLKGVTVLLAPVDFRKSNSIPKTAGTPAWTDALHAQIKTKLTELPLEKSK